MLQPFDHAVVFIYFFQFFIQNNDQRIDMSGQGFQSLFGDFHAYMLLLGKQREGL